MSSTTKEIELRAEVPVVKRQMIEKRVLSQVPLTSSDNRLSVLFLGSIDNIDFDIRVRINSDKYAEVVLKRGNFHAHDRLELNQKIVPEQFLGFVKIFSALGFKSKVMHRKTKRFFSEKEQYEIALVDAETISYIEVERIVDTKDKKVVEQERNKLTTILTKLGLVPIDKKQFDDLCQRLTTQVDWVFTGSKEDYRKLEAELKSFER